jgi:hypothetical protein
MPLAEVGEIQAHALQQLRRPPAAGLHDPIEVLQHPDADQIVGRLGRDISDPAGERLPTHASPLLSTPGPAARGFSGPPPKSSSAGAI